MTQALLDAILAVPDDRNLRLVYADALMEQGDPRGEWIALCCAPEAGDEAELRRRTLWQAHGEAWRAADLRGYRLSESARVEYRDGLVGAASLPLDVAVVLAPTLARWPVQTLTLYSLHGSGVRALADEPLLQRVRELDFEYERDPVPPAMLVRLLRAAENVRSLRFGSTAASLCDEVLPHVPWLGNVRELTLSAGTLTPAHVDWLARAMPQLQSLAVHGVTPAALWSIARAPWQLERLTVAEYEHTRERVLDPAAIADVLGGALVPRLVALALDGCRLDALVARAVMRLPPTLRTLSLRRCEQAEPVLAALAASRLPMLEELDLGGLDCGGDELAAAAGFPTLRRASLAETTIPAELAARLGELPALESLDLSYADVDGAGLRALLAGAAAHSLRDLDVQHNDVDGRAVQEGLRAGKLARLRSLGLSGNTLGVATLRALAAAPFSFMQRLAVDRTMRTQVAPVFADGWRPVGEPRFHVFERVLAAPVAPPPKGPSRLNAIRAMAAARRAGGRGSRSE